MNWRRLATASVLSILSIVVYVSPDAARSQLVVRVVCSTRASLSG